MANFAQALPCRTWAALSSQIVGGLDARTFHFAISSGDSKSASRAIDTMGLPANRASAERSGRARQANTTSENAIRIPRMVLTPYP